MKVNNIIQNNRWYVIPCECGKEELNKYPLKDCLHCKFEECEKSIPKNDFKIKENVLDKNGKITKTITRTIKEIFLVHGDKYQDVIGWSF